MRQVFAMIANAMFADVAELADALDLGSSTARCEGSSPFVRIYEFITHTTCTVYLYSDSLFVVGDRLLSL